MEDLKPELKPPTEEAPKPLFRIPFSIGETIPLKGIVFKIVGVTPERHLILAPEGFTNKFMKSLKK